MLGVAVRKSYDLVGERVALFLGFHENNLNIDV